MGKEEVDEVAKVLMDKALFRIDGKYAEVNTFEKEFREHMGVEHCLFLSSGTGGLMAALAALGIGPGDEVIIPGYTFIATAVAVLAVGAIPVLAEVNETLTIDVKDVEKKLSPHTKAVIPVHIQGFPSDMGGLLGLKKKHGFKIIEDACQSDGGSYGGKRLGTIGDCGAFSFNYYKIISCGEGGALVCHDRDVYQRAVIYHDCGTAFWPYPEPITEPLFTGVNMRVSEISGAVMRVQLTRLEGILKDLRKNKKRLLETAKAAGLTPNPSNDAEGDCGVCLPILFETEEKAIAFEKTVGGGRPINTGKHVYSAWSPVLEKRGAHVKGMNPYFSVKNQGLKMDYDTGSCPKTLDYLKRSVYIPINPDWTEEEIQDLSGKIKEGAN